MQHAKLFEAWPLILRPFEGERPVTLPVAAACTKR
jgi:hypothetical protein